MRRVITIGALCVLAIIAMCSFVNNYFALEVQAMMSRLFSPPTVRKIESKQLRRTAGWLSRDCGVVNLHDDPTLAISCAKDAMREHRSFRVAFEWVGIDSRGMIGLARTSSGDIYEITTDEMSAGGGVFNEPPSRVVTAQKCGVPPSEVAFGLWGTRVLSCLTNKMK